MTEESAGKSVKPARRAAKPKRDGYVVMRKFRFNGHDVKPGEQAPVEMLSHRRFESYVSTGLVKLVRS